VFTCTFEFKSETLLVYRDNVSGDDHNVELDAGSLSFDAMLALSAYVFSTPEDQCEPRLLKLLGRYLFDFVLPEEKVPKLRERVITSCRDRRAHINLLFREPAAQYAQLPWEFLILPGPDRRRFLGEIKNVSVTLTRFLPTQQQIRPAGDTLRLLVDVASPDDQAEIAFGELEKKLEQLQQRSHGQLEFRLERDRTLDEIERDLETFQPDIYHFSGHGEHDALWLARRDREEARQSLDPVRRARAVYGFRSKIESEAFKASIDAIASLFDIEKPPQLVVLDACNSDWSWLSEMLPGVAHQLVEHVPAVVAMRYPISNQAAERFSVHLYEKILEGRNLDEAVQSARNSLYISDPSLPGASSRAFGTPVLYVNSSSPLCGSLITTATAATKQSQRAVQPDRTEDCPHCGGEGLFAGGRCVKCRIRFTCYNCGCRFTWHQLKALAEEGGLCPDNDGQDCDASFTRYEPSRQRVDPLRPDLEPLQASGLVTPTPEPPKPRRFGQPPTLGDVAS
jgi:hypothetical protein